MGLINIQFQGKDDSFREIIKRYEKWLAHYEHTSSGTEDGVMYENYNSRSMEETQLAYEWEQLKDLIECDSDVGPVTIVTATGKDGWNDFRLLHHFDPTQKLDILKPPPPFAEKHRVWELRHSACTHCHGKPDDPCICGHEPCKQCGYEYGPPISLNENGCDKCAPPERLVKTIDRDAAWPVYVVDCPYCKASNIVDCDSMGGFQADILQCHACNTKAWLGEDTEYDYDEDINDEDACIEVGRTSI